MSKKFIAVLNKKIEVGRVMNALAHACIGLSSLIEGDQLGVVDYKDKDGGPHVASKFPFIILRADNSNKIRTLRNDCISKDIKFASFTDAMTVGGWEEQIKRSSDTPEEDLEYYAICLYGEEADLQDLTKKFSLWK
jgi:hypothetical protein